MSKLDIVKETIAYLKLWLGIMVVSNISLIGWILSNVGAASELKTFGAIIGVGVITLSAFFVHKRIEYMISSLEEL